MSSLKIQSRELKSFKINNQINKIRSFFEKPNSFGIFAMYDSLHPNERILLRDSLNKRNLKITCIPKNISKIMFKAELLKGLKNLIQNNIILITDINNNTINDDNIRFILSDNKFSVRFIFSNNQIYRVNKIKTYLSSLEHEKHVKSLISLVTFNMYKNTILPLILINKLNSNNNTNNINK
jgi:hypothetical protein